MDFDYTRIKVLGEKLSSSLLFNLPPWGPGRRLPGARLVRAGCSSRSWGQPGSYSVCALDTHKVFPHFCPCCCSAWGAGRRGTNICSSRAVQSEQEHKLCLGTVDASWLLLAFAHQSSHTLEFIFFFFFLFLFLFFLPFLFLLLLFLPLPLPPQFALSGLSPSQQHAGAQHCSSVAPGRLSVQRRQLDARQWQRPHAAASLCQDQPLTSASCQGCCLPQCAAVSPATLGHLLCPAPLLWWFPSVWGLVWSPPSHQGGEKSLEWAIKHGSGLALEEEQDWEPEAKEKQNWGDSCPSFSLRLLPAALGLMGWWTEEWLFCPPGLFSPLRFPCSAIPGSPRGQEFLHRLYPLSSCSHGMLSAAAGGSSSG